MKRMIITMLTVLLLSVSSGAFAQGMGDSMTFPVAEDMEFGGVNIDVPAEEFERLGLEFGDSIDAHFSSGFVLEDIPYHNGYYVALGHPLLVNYPGAYIQFAFNSGDPMWEVSGCSAGDRVTVSVREKGKYLDRQSAMSSTYVDDRDAFGSDEEFANFRAMTGGALRSNTFFRGASPVDNIHQRAKTVDMLLGENGIGFVLDLSDNAEKMASYMEREDFCSGNAASLYEKGRISFLAMNASYLSDDFREKTVRGFREMMAQEGAYYIHCTEGKDRTGFVCMLLEALAGASYEEIEADYMKTYDNYYGITPDSDSTKYDALKTLRLDDMLLWFAGLPEGTELEGMYFKDAAESYLRSSGMSDEEIGELEIFLTA